MATVRIGQAAKQLFLGGQTAAGTEIPLIGNAVFHQEVVAANTQRHAGGIQLAVTDDHIVVVVARHRIVAGVDVAFFDEHIVAGADIDAVLTAVDSHIAESDIFTLEQGMAPVAAV